MLRRDESVTGGSWCIAATLGLLAYAGWICDGLSGVVAGDPTVSESLRMPLAARPSKGHAGESPFDDDDAAGLGESSIGTYRLEGRGARDEVEGESLCAAKEDPAGAFGG